MRRVVTVGLVLLSCCQGYAETRVAVLASQTAGCWDPATEAGSGCPAGSIEATTTESCCSRAKVWQVEFLKHPMSGVKK
jgi:hypothetical protein